MSHAVYRDRPALRSSQLIFVSVTEYWLLSRIWLDFYSTKLILFLTLESQATYYFSSAPKFDACCVQLCPMFCAPVNSHSTNIKCKFWNCFIPNWLLIFSKSAWHCQITLSLPQSWKTPLPVPAVARSVILVGLFICFCLWFCGSLAGKRLDLARASSVFLEKPDLRLMGTSLEFHGPQELVRMSVLTYLGWRVVWESLVESASKVQGAFCHAAVQPTRYVCHCISIQVRNMRAWNLPVHIWHTEVQLMTNGLRVGAGECELFWRWRAPLPLPTRQYFLSQLLGAIFTRGPHSWWKQVIRLTASCSGALWKLLLWRFWVVFPWQHILWSARWGRRKGLLVSMLLEWNAPRAEVEVKTESFKYFL